MQSSREEVLKALEQAQKGMATRNGGPPPFDPAEVPRLDVSALTARFTTCRDYLLSINPEVRTFTRALLQRTLDDASAAAPAHLDAELTGALDFLRRALERLQEALPEEELRNLGIRP